MERAAEQPRRRPKRYAPAKRRSLRPPRDEKVSLTGTSTPRSDDGVAARQREVAAGVVGEADAERRAGSFRTGPDRPRRGESGSRAATRCRPGSRRAGSPAAREFGRQRASARPSAAGLRPDLRSNIPNAPPRGERVRALSGRPGIPRPRTPNCDDWASRSRRGSSARASEQGSAHLRVLEGEGALVRDPKPRRDERRRRTRATASRRRRRGRTWPPRAASGGRCSAGGRARSARAARCG